jgi:SAM-dependent methyltransferase
VITETHDEAEQPWYIRYYQERFAEEYEPFDEATTQAQVDFVESVLRLSPPARILDLACGWGRHSRPLGQRGYDVVGLDLSPAFLRAAGAAQQSGTSWVRGDMRWLPFASASFDVVICLWNSFGYFDDAGNRQVVREASRLLVPGGALLLDIPNRDFLLGWRVLGRDWNQEGEAHVLRSRRLDPLSSVLHNETMILRSDGSSQRYDMHVRCYTFPELRGLLASEGLEADPSVFGEYDLAEGLSLDSYQLIVVARKGSQQPVSSP